MIFTGYHVQILRRAAQALDEAADNLDDGTTIGMQDANRWSDLAEALSDFAAEIEEDTEEETKDEVRPF